MVLSNRYSVPCWDFLINYLALLRNCILFRGKLRDIYLLINLRYLAEVCDSVLVKRFRKYRNKRNNRAKGNFGEIKLKTELNRRICKKIKMGGKVEFHRHQSDHH